MVVQKDVEGDLPFWICRYTFIVNGTLRSGAVCVRGRDSNGASLAAAELLSTKKLTGVKLKGIPEVY